MFISYRFSTIAFSVFSHKLSHTTKIILRTVKDRIKLEFLYKAKGIKLWKKIKYRVDLVTKSDLNPKNDDSSALVCLQANHPWGSQHFICWWRYKGQRHQSCTSRSKIIQMQSYPHFLCRTKDLKNSVQ